MDKKPTGKSKQSLVVWSKEKLPLAQKKAERLLSSLVTAGSKGRENIPNASLIYGVAAAVLLAIALYYFFTGIWFNGFLLFVIGAVMFGYALHFLQNPD